MTCPGFARRPGCQVYDHLALSEPGRWGERRKSEGSQSWPHRDWRLLPSLVSQVAALLQGKVLQDLSFRRPWPHCPMCRLYSALFKVPPLLRDILLSLMGTLWPFSPFLPSSHCCPRAASLYRAYPPPQSPFFSLAVLSRFH